MYIKFIVDYRGRETGENFFQKGSIADLPSEEATFLIDDGRAVEVKDLKPPAKKEKPVGGKAAPALLLEGEEPDQEEETKP